jgi:diguanylate cyclase (GGDEF)-like protein/PAS domain S-box-containing protein
MNRQVLKQCGLAVCFYVLFISSIWLYLFTPTQQLQDSWEQELDRFIESSTQLTSLVDDFGYGGFLVNFQEFLKSRNIAELDNAIDNLNLILARLQVLKSLNSEEPEILSLIDNIEIRVVDYEATATTLKNNISFSAFMSYSIVKRKITKQDPAILFSIDKLVTINSQKLNEVKQKTIELKKAHDRALIYWCIGASLFYLLIVVLFISFSRKHRNTYSQLACLNEHSPTATLLFDEKGQILQVNSAFRNIFGLNENQNLRAIDLDILLPTIYDQSLALLKNRPIDKDQLQVMNFIIDANKLDNKQVPVEVSVSSISLDGKRVAFALINDKTKEEKLQKKARTDGLTKVFNRGYAEELIRLELARIKRSEQPLSLLLIDIDYFKKINDTLGHGAGDEMLKSMVSILKKSLRKTDLIARWGGDEFLILLPDTSYEYAEVVAAKLVDLAHYAFKGEAIQTSVSIGVAKAEAKDTMVSLVNKADEALYETKLRGRNGYTLYNQVPH